MKLFRKLPRIEWVSPPKNDVIERPEDVVRRGMAAKELLNNSILRDTLQAVRTDLNTQLMEVSLADVNSHTRLITALQITRAIERHILRLIEDGDAAAEHIQLRGTRID